MPLFAFLCRADGPLHCNISFDNQKCYNRKRNYFTKPEQKHASNKFMTFKLHLIAARVETNKHFFIIKWMKLWERWKIWTSGVQPRITCSRKRRKSTSCQSHVNIHIKLPSSTLEFTSNWIPLVSQTSIDYIRLFQYLSSNNIVDNIFY